MCMCVYKVILFVFPILEALYTYQIPTGGSGQLVPFTFIVIMIIAIFLIFWGVGRHNVLMVVETFSDSSFYNI